MKAQSAMEFIFLASLMLLVILGISVIMSSKVLEAREEANKRIAEDIANLAYREIEMSKTVNDGYTRFFEMPQTINDVAYEIKVIDNKELVVNYLGYEHIQFLPTDFCGDVSIPKNEIDKENGIVCLNSILDATQCQNSQDLDLCDNIDDELLPGAKCCCCSRYNLCC